MPEGELTSFIFYGIWRISLFCGSSIVIEVKKVGRAENI